MLAHRCRWDDGTMVAVHNLGPTARTVPLTVDGCTGEHVLVDLLQDATTAQDDRGRMELALEGYGYRTSASST